MNSLSQGEHTQGRHLKVIKNQSQRCVCVREGGGTRRQKDRERKVILILTFTVGVLGQRWAAVCLENKSQWSSFPEGLTRQSHCAGIKDNSGLFPT